MRSLQPGLCVWPIFMLQIVQTLSQSIFMVGLFLTMIWGTRCALQHVLGISEKFYIWSCSVDADPLTWVVYIKSSREFLQRAGKKHLNWAFWGHSRVQHQFDWKAVTAMWRIDVSPETGNGPFSSSLCHYLFSLLRVYISFGFFSISSF